MPSLQSLLAYLNSGYSGQAADDSIINHFGGDDLLTAAKQYDPNAHWETVTNGDGGSGRTLVVDIEKLPSSKVGKAGYDLRGTNHGSRMKNPNAAVKDDAYGDVTNSANFYEEKDAAWTKFAPLLVTFAAPMAAAALASAGIGGAGLTAAATGSGLGSAAPGWAGSLVKGLPGNARSLSEGSFDFTKLLPFLGQLAGVNPTLTSGGMTLAQLARKRP